MIYADNAATTQLDSDALQAMIPYLAQFYGNPSQPYSFSRKQKQALREARERIAQCIGATAEEIYFTSGGTESDNWAIKGFLEYLDTRAIVTSSVEHHAVLKACEAVERLGFPVAYVEPNRDGFICPDTLEAIMSENTKLVSIMMANNEIGTIQPIKELSAITHRYGALFHTDAVQAVGNIPVNVKELDVDMLSASAHKFHGPRGIGFLYIKKKTPINSYMNGGSQEFGMRAGTENVAAIVGMSVALQKNCTTLKEAQEQKKICSERLKQLLTQAGVDYICNGVEPQIPGNMSFSFRGVDGEMLLHRLDLMGICVSTGSACNGSKTEVSHVLEAIKVPEDYIKGTIRISIGKNVRCNDIDRIAHSIHKIVSGQAER